MKKMRVSMEKNMKQLLKYKVMKLFKQCNNS